MKKLLKPIIVGTTLLSFIYGCGPDYEKHHFHGEIEGEIVEFKERCYGRGHFIYVLNVKKEDGREISYKDYLKGDLKIEYVTIKKHDLTFEYYIHNNVGSVVVEEAQKQFDDYLIKIGKLKKEDSEREIKEKEKKINEALELIK